ncbi:response regulator [Streptomyces tropicalis]|uniref:response regulator n=1 Tax=Streptomyces tropicalis TaxID=3034234 RepID=UPI003F68B8DD
MPSDTGILIVDDHQHTLYALESALAPLGHRITVATSGDEALKQALRGRVGLLLLDVRMPGTGGLEVVRHLRRLEQTRHIPVVLLTGFGHDHALAVTAFRLGVADLLTTPVDPWTLRTKVRYLYDAHRRQQALQDEVRALRALAAGHPRPADTAPPARHPPRPDRPRPAPGDHRPAPEDHHPEPGTRPADPGGHPGDPGGDRPEPGTPHPDDGTPHPAPRVPPPRDRHRAASA